MAPGTGGSLEEIERQIMAGQPGTLTAAGAAFKAAADGVRKVTTGIPQAVKAGTGGDNWTGEGADAFVTYSDEMTGDITAAAAPLAGYESAMNDAASALTDAQKQIQDYVKQAQQYR